MSVLGKLKGTLNNPPHGTAKPGFKGLLVDKGERWGGAALVGAAKGYYGERFLWQGHGLDLWGGALATLLSGIFRGSKLASHLERVGDVGLMSAFGSLGAAWGASKAGRVVQVHSPGKNVKGIGSSRSQVLGAIAPAASGPYLSFDDIMKHAAAR